MENRAIHATALRELRGTRANRWIRLRTTGVDATRCPPTMTMIICIVNGTSAQKLLPPSKTRRPGSTPLRTPRMKAATTPNSAITRGSGNQRSLQAASARPTRARLPSR